MTDPERDDPFAPFVAAAASADDALPLLERGGHDLSLVLEIEHEGRRKYGDLGLSRGEVASGFARLVLAGARADRAAGIEPGTPAELANHLVRADVYFAEALHRGRDRAWRAFEDVLEGAYRSVRAHVGRGTARPLLVEIRDAVLGTFYLDGKISTYRATAPIGAWARQVIFNLFRQRLAQKKSAHEGPAISQLGEAENEVDGLLPPSRELAPPEALVQGEWAVIFARIVPAVLASLEPDEQRMLELLPTARMTQVDLCQELGISPFKLNRWYKEVRQRFLRAISDQLRTESGAGDLDPDHLIAFLAERWGRGKIPESPQDDPGGHSLPPVGSRPELPGADSSTRRGAWQGTLGTEPTADHELRRTADEAPPGNA